jgi:CRP/FNR family transcriptional regulator, nitrogen fixation regulation protein
MTGHKASIPADDTPRRYVPPGSERPRRALDALAVVTCYRRGQEIRSRQGAAGNWYRVVAGVAGRCAVRAGGRRQIVDLLLPGDFFLGGTSPADLHCSVEAVVEGTAVACFPRERVERLAASDPDAAHEIRCMTSAITRRLEEQILILGGATATKKIGCFLLKMAERCSEGETDKNGMVLPMSRYDIADYLALSVETVSRSLTELKQRGAIALVGTRRVRIVDHVALDDEG